MIGDDLFRQFKQIFVFLFVRNFVNIFSQSLCSVFCFCLEGLKSTEICFICDVIRILFDAPDFQFINFIPITEEDIKHLSHLSILAVADTKFNSV